MVYAPSKGPTRISNSSESVDNFAIMIAIGNILLAIKTANGDSLTNTKYYGSIILGKGNNEMDYLGGGIGMVGQYESVGDQYYSGVFIHEAGHSFGLLHANESYNIGGYPYVGGSLKGSAWGFDARGNGTFLNPLTGKKCKGHRIYDGTSGRCYKQSIMQSGNGDQSSEFLFSMIGDYEAGLIQTLSEGTTTIVNGTHQYDKFRVYPDSNSPSGYSQWDSIDLKKVPFKITNDQYGLYSVNRDMPIVRGIPVYSIIFGTSLDPFEGNTIIYPPLFYLGNLIKLFNPLDESDLQQINNGENQWYCRGTGCDYTAKITYSDNSVSYWILKLGFRKWWNPTGSFKSTDHKDPSNYKIIVINIDGSKTLSRVDLLSTPTVYMIGKYDAKSLSKSPVIASWEPNKYK